MTDNMNTNLVTITLNNQMLTFIGEKVFSAEEYQQITECAEQAKKETPIENLTAFIVNFINKTQSKGLPLDYIQDDNILTINMNNSQCHHQQTWDCSKCIYRFVDYTQEPCNSCISPMGKNFMEDLS